MGKLFLWHLNLTLIVSDVKMQNLSLIPVGELKIDIVLSFLSAMNYSLCLLLSTSMLDFHYCSFVPK